MSSLEITSIIIGAGLTGFITYLWDKQLKSEANRKEEFEELVNKVTSLDGRVDKCEWEISRLKEEQNKHDATSDKIFQMLADINKTLGEIQQRLAKVEA